MATPPCQLCLQPSVYYCTCQDPPTPCCHDCSYRHHQTTGAHSWVVFAQVGKRNISCGMCTERLAETVCCCDFPVAYLCPQCRDSHILKDSMKMHFLQPLEKAEMIKSRDDIDRARRVLDNKDRIEEFMNRNNAAAGKLKDEVKAFAAELIDRINSAKEATLKEIEKFENLIEETRRNLRQEVELHLFEEVESADALIKQAFNLSNPFTCAEVLVGDLCREEQISPRLARLQCPSFLGGSQPQVAQVDLQGSQVHPPPSPLAAAPASPEPISPQANFLSSYQALFGLNPLTSFQAICGFKSSQASPLEFVQKSPWSKLLREGLASPSVSVPASASHPPPISTSRPSPASTVHPSSASPPHSPTINPFGPLSAKASYGRLSEEFEPAANIKHF